MEIKARLARGLKIPAELNGGPKSVHMDAGAVITFPSVESFEDFASKAGEGALERLDEEKPAPEKPARGKKN